MESGAHKVEDGGSSSELAKGFQSVNSTNSGRRLGLRWSGAIVLLGLMTDNSGRDQNTEPARSMEDGGLEQKPVFTIAIMAVAILIFAWQNLISTTLLDNLVPNGVEIYVGRWDALISSNFVHGDLLHIGFNLCWIWMLGKVLEAQLSRAQYLILFFSCAVFSSAVELAFTGQVGVGLSGVVYGWAGFMWFAGHRFPVFRNVLTKKLAHFLLGWLILCFVLTHFQILNVANGGHVGGLVAGSAIGLAIVRSASVTFFACCALWLLTAASLLYAPWSSTFLASRIIVYIEKQDAEKTLVALKQISSMDGDLRIWAHMVAGQMFESRRELQTVTQIYEQGLPFSYDDPDYLNNYAWFLATTPNAAIRQGEKAVRLATWAAEKTDWGNFYILDTLAAAYAAKGDFDSAITWQSKVVDAEPEDADILSRLKLYKAGKPFVNIEGEAD